MSSDISKNLQKPVVLYGVAGWAYDDWAGIVYPEPRPRGFDALEYLTGFFGVIEINSSFYRIPAERAAARWANVASKIHDFEFTMKLWQGFTHERDWDESSAQAFDRACRPLAEAGKLGAILVQYPWSFKAGDKSKDAMRRVLDRFQSHRLVVEIRHQSWLDDGEIFEILKANQAAFCNIDQPALNNNIPLTDHVTAPHAYLRLHGRNRKHWFQQKESYPGARYDYNYKDEELMALVNAVRSLKQKANRIHVIANNHLRGQAPSNALQIQALVEEATVQAPKELIDYYNGLGPDIVPAKKEGGEQLEMF